MLTLKTNGKDGAYQLNLPTKLNEITPEYIKEITSHIKIDAFYTLVGLVYKERLSTLVLAARKNSKKSDISVVPIFVKAGKTDSAFINNLSIGEKLIISPSDIMMGYHVSAPKNQLTINNILDILNDDATACAKCLNIKEDCYFIEFKLVPNCNIHGSYLNVNQAVNNPFVTKLPNVNIDKPNIII